MSVWSDLRIELLRLADAEPRVLLSYPSPEGEPDRLPPFHVRLTSSALPVAEDLHRRFGDALRLRVGALPYPLGPDDSPFAPWLHEYVDLDHRLDGIRVALAGPLSVRSGQTAHHHVQITNETGSELEVRTNGTLTARVVDLQSGKHVGGFSGAQHQPLVRFAIAPKQTVRIPLLVGTSSYLIELGYAIPPGRWGVTADLALSDGRTLEMPVLQFDVIE